MDVVFADHTHETYGDKPIARGGQGAVYLSQDGKHVVKIFNVSGKSPQWIAQREAQVDKIINDYNVVRDDPPFAELYAWPQLRVVAPGPGVRTRFVKGPNNSGGHAAPGQITADKYFYMNSYRNLPLEQKGWWIGRVACAIKLARAVGRLADYGLCHSDLSEKNIMVDPFHGRLTLIDCDSLVVPHVLKADVDGTPGYMAPELTSGRVTSPSVETDRHALAVLLYRWLLFRHPLDGPLVHDLNDAKNDDMLRYGDKALYAEHPLDQSNRPAKLQLTTAHLTERLEQLFYQAFVTALHTPDLRPSPLDWEEALLELTDRVIPCARGDCDMKFFAATDSQPLRCPLCSSWAAIPKELPILRLRALLPDSNGGYELTDETVFGHYLVGWHGRALHTWHASRSAQSVPLPGDPAPDADPVALVTYDQAGDEWLLENRRLGHMQENISDDPDQQQWQPVPVGMSVPLREGAQFLLGPVNDARGVEVEMRDVYGFEP